MKFQNCFIEGIVIIEPDVYKDERGWFVESYSEDKLKGHVDCKFIQDNTSLSVRNTLRGLHYQKGESAQAKLVSVLHGKVYDVMLDLRPESKTYMRYYAIILEGAYNKQVFIPRGFAHGFYVMSDCAMFSYKVDNKYDKKSEAGIRWNDPIHNIFWPTPDPLVSEKDNNYLDFIKQE